MPPEEKIVLPSDPLTKGEIEALCLLGSIETKDPRIEKGFSREARAWRVLLDDAETWVKIHGRVVSGLMAKRLLARWIPDDGSALARAALTVEGRDAVKRAQRLKDESERRKVMRAKGSRPKNMRGRLTRRWHQKNDSEILKAFGDGLGPTVSQIAQDFGIKPRSVRRILRKAGVMEPAARWPDHVKDRIRSNRGKVS